MRKVEMHYMIKKKALLQAIEGNLVIRGSHFFLKITSGIISCFRSFGTAVQVC
jgi:hypothetical protein